MHVFTIKKIRRKGIFKAVTGHKPLSVFTGLQFRFFVNIPV
jgi:hypothetical protein